MAELDYDSGAFKSQISKIKDLANYKLDLDKLAGLTSEKMAANEVGNIFFDLAILLPFYLPPVYAKTTASNANTIINYQYVVVSFLSCAIFNTLLT